MSMSASGMTRLVAGREISVKLHDRGFLISTAVFLLVIIGSIAVPALFFSDPPQLRVATTAEARPVAELAASLGAAEERPPGVPEADITVVDASDPVAALDDPEVDASLSIEDGTVVITARDGVDGDLETLVTAASSTLAVEEAAAAADLTDAEVAALVAPPAPAVTLLEPEPDYAVPPQVLIMVFGFLFYFVVLTFGISISQSVVEEKQSRVVELLVAAVPVRWLLAGKVLGNSIMAIGQVALMLAAGLIGASLTGSGDIVEQALGASGWFLAFFVVGFLMLACLWAVAGSLASRIEDLQSTTLYMQLAVMVPFFAALFVTDEGPARVFLSYFPLTAPLLMPSRLVTGDAAAWEPWVALILVLLTAAVLVRIGARLYAGSVLHTSARIKVLAAWQAGASRA
ncbi:ABC transporter permease [Demequina silvatica]|uniref:ABC transporter permease n=1 Tax=Demequina silvatica TaxID=1638988 RepID=UPI000AF8E204|nr:ABC transporter permease [Demequina silvatica]